ncbi:LysR family transcriptional regulator [Anaerolentibacter hominis]|uniref:LysR family transcriptional regulator n=1 Tax=Anaerolentibacter hominis TaxID=3079009 RepID=UPI0031B81DB3
MDIKQLQYFVTVVNEGSITAAAKKLHMSQPPLSSQMKALETELGVTLFVRGSRKVSVTDAGQLLYERANMIIELAGVTERELGSMGSHLDGTLRIGTISSSGIVLEHYIKPFKDQHPAMRYEVYEGNTFQLIEMLKTGVIELALVRTPFASEGFECIYLPPEEMVAVGESRYFEGMNKDDLRLQDLADSPIIFYRRFEALLTEHFQQKQLNPSILCANDDARTTILWANAGLGIGIVPETIADLMKKEGIEKCRLSDEGLRTRITLIRRKDRYQSFAAKRFEQLFREKTGGKD